eukprot:scaffold125033_cov36-Phaeocystis_antarctica.AAC.1
MAILTSFVRLTTRTTRTVVLLMAAALSTRHMYLLWQDVELRHLLFSGDKAKESGALGKSAPPAPWLAAAAPAPWLAGAAPPGAAAASAADNED